jgi:hypothetical protein
MPSGCIEKTASLGFIAKGGVYPLDILTLYPLLGYIEKTAFGFIAKGAGVLLSEQDLSIST